MAYPDAEKSSKPIKIAKNLDKSIEDFLKTERSQQLGYRFKSDVVNAGVRDLLVRYGFLEDPGDLEHYNVYGDHVTIWDKKLRQLVDVYFREGRVYCTYDESESCDHVRFVFTIPKVIELLEARGWLIAEGKVLKRPS